ncbi:hypothetical protein TNCV_1469751 [Trichonephila clavipes]|nr:hypothetical protein TNCV_1469751 [Trichonephila clavipes]
MKMRVLNRSCQNDRLRVMLVQVHIAITSQQVHIRHLTKTPNYEANQECQIEFQSSGNPDFWNKKLCTFYSCKSRVPNSKANLSTNGYHIISLTTFAS